MKCSFSNDRYERILRNWTLGIQNRQESDDEAIDNNFNIQIDEIPPKKN